MKKFNYLFGWLFCGAALLGFGCDDDKTDVPPPTVTFEIATPEASSNSVSVTVTPSDDKTTYFAGVTESSSVEGLADEELVAEMVARSDFDKCLYMGKKDVSATGLKADTDYTVVVFSYQNKEVGAVVKKTVRTQKEGDGPTPGDFKIEITVTDITHNSAKVKVTPSDDTVDYYVNVFPKSEVERDGKMLEGWEFIKYYGQDPYIGNKTQKGVYERSLSGLSSSYSYVVAAYDLSQDEEVVYYEFLTTKAPDVPDQFQITNIQPTTTGVTFTVTPQSADEWYCAWITMKSTYESFEPESYIQGVYYGLNNIAVDKQMTMSDYVKSIAKQGTAEWSNYDGDLKPKTDYVILAFYVDPNNEDQLKVYDYAYTKAEFRTETPETEISLTLGDIKNLTDNGDGTAEVTVHVKASLATSYRIGAHTQTEIDEEIANGYGPEDWGDFWISWRPSSDVEGICSPEGADVTALIPFVAGQGYCLIFRVRSEDGNTKTEYKPLNKWHKSEILDLSHMFKNLMFQTRHTRVAGIGNTRGSQRAMNLLFAIRDIQRRTGRDLGATFLSGTVVVNALTELYVMFKYLRPQELRRQSIGCFDAWAAIFTKKSADYELGVTGTIRRKERFRSYIKVPELAMFLREITDYRTAEMINLDVPEKNVRFLSHAPTFAQEEMIGRLMAFAHSGAWADLGLDMPEPDNLDRAKMLIATDIARKMPLDMRLLGDRFRDSEDNKSSICARTIYDYYVRSEANRGTQFVFSDLSTYKPNAWNIYSNIKDKLVRLGIPADEIRFIQCAQTERARKRLFEDMNAGRVRVLFGSTSMLGTGVNAQERAVAVHHLDIPWVRHEVA